ncbi:hypothetical protein SAMN06265371_11087 [Lutibacter agarilyticus]|uniref:Uncharacterized protein n=1 Tax=Lutibacter agarilyticus TaxID=1109740 RepID=A0A238YQ67_9FLAO|nr:hypothetical protein [Lutibacter agarilyticus]SNR73285.1 hypothetical protein SAMN06265371_11087 [Lutibacter agarilyticus]
MKILLFLFISVFSFKTSPVVEEVRNQFPEISSEEQADNFIEQLTKDASAEAKSYIAAMNFMKSRFVKNPFTKLKYFKIGKKELDAVILNNPKNIEMRYIRYLMQKQIPGFLNYSDNIEEDFKLLSTQLVESNYNNTFKLKIINNMLLVSNLTDNEKEILTKLETNI